MLLLVRDPQEHSYSLWAQKVKRAGERRSLEAFRESYDGTRMATRFLQESQAFNEFAAASGEDAEPMAPDGVAGSMRCRLPSQPGY